LFLGKRLNIIGIILIFIESIVEFNIFNINIAIILLLIFVEINKLKKIIYHPLTR